MVISENKMQIVIDNYFKSECDINTSIRSAFEKGFRIGVKKASSAQPEIIHCRNCKHWTETCGDKQWGLGDCDVFDKHLVMCNGYCAWAERREE